MHERVKKMISEIALLDQSFLLISDIVEANRDIKNQEGFLANLNWNFDVYFLNVVFQDFK